MCIEGNASEFEARQCEYVSNGPNNKKEYSWYQKQPPGAGDEEKTQSAPTIPKRFQMRGVGLPTIGVQGDGDFRNALPVKSCLDDHLRCEFHPGTPEVEAIIKRLGKG